MNVCGIRLFSTNMPNITGHLTESKQQQKKNVFRRCRRGTQTHTKRDVMRLLLKRITFRYSCMFVVVVYESAPLWLWMLMNRFPHYFISHSVERACAWCSVVFLLFLSLLFLLHQHIVFGKCAEQQVVLSFCIGGSRPRKTINVNYW